MPASRPLSSADHTRWPRRDGMGSYTSMTRVAEGGRRPPRPTRQVFQALQRKVSTLWILSCASRRIIQSRPLLNSKRHTVWHPGVLAMGESKSVRANVVSSKSGTCGAKARYHCPIRLFSPLVDREVSTASSSRQRQEIYTSCAEMPGCMRCGLPMVYCPNHSRIRPWPSRRFFAS
jgi:hypothetical protein